MTLSLWRYSHLLLALSSSLFLIIASVTGVILACEPISNTLQGHSVVDLQEVSVATTIHQLREEHDQVISIKVTTDDFVIASIITREGNKEAFYIDPKTGYKLGIVKKRASLYTWTTNLHRSLFLKGVGRFFVGLVSLLLFFIAITGVLLLTKRQGGFLKLYSRVKERDFNQRYHVILGRWLLFPIIIMGATGVYLSAEKFGLVTKDTVQHNWNKKPLLEDSTSRIADIPFFQELKMSQIRELTFPFSKDKQDYFEISLNNRDLLIHQYSGEIMSEIKHPFTHFLSYWSLQLHTGRGNFLWSVILLIASASILFFIFSGFAMYLKRRIKTKTIPCALDKDDCEIIILIGSEGGHTYAFGKALFLQLSQQGKKVFLGILNEYTRYQKATQLLICTSTYGDGNAPSNARHFLENYKTIKQPKLLNFAVLGFGSLDYPHFCRFAIQVDAVLHQQENCIPLLPLEKINEQSKIDLQKWLDKWSKATGTTLVLEVENKKTNRDQFTVIKRSVLNTDDTFLLTLKPPKKFRSESGDIIHILTPDAQKTRAYSIAKIGSDILLSIKKHDYGVCSSFLSKLEKGNQVTASIEKNKKFHLPSKKAPVIMIANGTGIAPFLAMIGKNKNSTLFWGGRSKGSFDLYQPFTKKAPLLNIHLAISREQQKRYVQDNIWDQRIAIAYALEKGGYLMICGSISMMNSVLDTLEKIADHELQIPLSHFEQQGQVLTDCY
jgi:sulfite reductase (NADPH) flavoprotein alpha-component